MAYVYYLIFPVSSQLNIPRQYDLVSNNILITPSTESPISERSPAPFGLNPPLIEQSGPSPPQNIQATLASQTYSRQPKDGLRLVVGQSNVSTIQESTQPADRPNASPANYSRSPHTPLRSLGPGKSYDRCISQRKSRQPIEQLFSPPTTTRLKKISVITKPRRGKHTKSRTRARPRAITTPPKPASLAHGAGLASRSGALRLTHHLFIPHAEAPHAAA